MKARQQPVESFLYIYGYPRLRVYIQDGCYVLKDIDLIYAGKQRSLYEENIAMCSVLYCVYVFYQPIFIFLANDL